MRPHLSDRAFRYGDGVFATLAVQGGRLLDADAHVRRLAASAGVIGLEVPEAICSAAGLVRILQRMGVPQEADGVARVQVSAAPGGRGYLRKSPSAWELVEYHGAPAGRDLTVAIVTEDEAPPAAVPSVKSCSALAHVLCAAAAARRGCTEAVRTARGCVLEASASNVFWAKDGELFTPAATLPLYPGVTRDLVIEAARRTGWAVREGEFEPADLRRATGAFLTNAARGVEPIRTLDGADLAWPAELEGLRASVEAARLETGLPIAGDTDLRP